MLAFLLVCVFVFVHSCRVFVCFGVFVFVCLNPGFLCLRGVVCL